MIIDQMVAGGDVNRDGIEDIVFCGNSGRVHVLTYQNGKYSVAFNSINKPPSLEGDFSQTCGIGDLTNDGHPDFYAVSKSGTKIYSHNDTEYVEVWTGPYSDGSNNPPIGVSAVGDADNDGYTELIYLEGLSIKIWESDVPNATTFTSEKNLPATATSSSSILIGNIR